MAVNSRNMLVIKQQIDVMALQFLHAQLIGIKYIPLL
jgi:hypothetical protein